MYEHAGLYVAEMHEEWCYATVVARRVSDSVIPELEGALRRAAMNERDTTDRRRAVEELRELPGRLASRLAELLPQLEKAQTAQEAIAAVQQIRQLWRGL
jgi:hypothetical protein